MELAHRLASSRGGTAALAALVALATGLAVLVYVRHYRSSVDQGGTPATVLVAKKAIPKGMSAAAAVSGGYFETQRLRADQLGDGAVADPTPIRTQVATRDVLPGEQISTADFGAAATGLATRLTGADRAVAIALDQPHGLAGQLQEGDRVDVLVGFSVQSLTTGIGQPVVKTLAQDVRVLAIEGGSGSRVGSGSQTASILLRVKPAQAAEIAYAADNGKVWLVLRPRVGAAKAKPALVTLQSLLLGTKPVLSAGK